MKYFSAPALLALAVTLGFTAIHGHAHAQGAVKICDKAKMPELKFLECEGGRLRNEGHRLARQAKIQITEGQRIVADCQRLDDKEAARDCNLLSSDLIEDAAFKQAESAGLLDEADRMDARANDLRKAATDQRRAKAREKR